MAVSKFLRNGKEAMRPKVEAWKAREGKEWVDVNLFYDPVGERWEGWYIDELGQPSIITMLN